jgi:hypothetical protein
MAGGVSRQRISFRIGRRGARAGGDSIRSSGQRPYPRVVIEVHDLEAGTGKLFREAVGREASVPRVEFGDPGFVGAAELFRKALSAGYFLRPKKRAYGRGPKKPLAAFNEGLMNRNETAGHGEKG